MSPGAGSSLTMRVAVFMLAISGVGVGVGLMVRAGLGVAPNDVMNTGLGDTVGWNVGTASWLTSAISMIIAWSLGRRPRLATVLGGVIVGLSINGTLAVIPAPDPLALRCAATGLGLVIVWAGITGVVSADV
ncbi:MAG: hypothetical protein WCK21_10090, partial [Actinomycetota bacterium]